MGSVGLAKRPGGFPFGETDGVQLGTAKFDFVMLMPGNLY